MRSMSAWHSPAAPLAARAVATNVRKPGMVFLTCLVGRPDLPEVALRSREETKRYPYSVGSRFNICQ